MGVGADALKKLHEQYGPIVRVGPNNLSFDGEIGWPAVFARRTPEYESSRGLSEDTSVSKQPRLRFTDDNGANFQVHSASPLY